MCRQHRKFLPRSNIIQYSVIRGLRCIHVDALDEQSSPSHSFQTTEAKPTPSSSKLQKCVLRQVSYPIKFRTFCDSDSGSFWPASGSVGPDGDASPDTSIVLAAWTQTDSTYTQNNSSVCSNPSCIEPGSRSSISLLYTSRPVCCQGYELLIIPRIGAHVATDIGLYCSWPIHCVICCSCEHGVFSSYNEKKLFRHK